MESIQKSEIEVRNGRVVEEISLFEWLKTDKGANLGTSEAMKVLVNYIGQDGGSRCMIK